MARIIGRSNRKRYNLVQFAAQPLSNREERSSMGILLKPISLILFAVLSFFAFLAIGRMSKSK
jgi:hypothetical protein